MVSTAPLTQVNRQNVSRLTKVWEYQLPEHPMPLVEDLIMDFRANPVTVNNRLYFCTPTSRVVALDPASGRELWRFDTPFLGNADDGYPLKCRGVAYWQADSTATHPSGADQQQCLQRIFVGTNEARLYALDANTGQSCTDFGTGGMVDLARNIGGYREAQYGPTSAPLVVDNKVIVGTRVMDNLLVDAPSGVVRAFDAVTGAQLWGWNPVAPGTAPYTLDDAGNKLYTAGTVNAWAPMTADPARGLVFVPTGNPSPDLYGGERNGSDFYGSSTVALDLQSGEVRWHFQTVHHDVWDYDVSSPPILLQHPGIGKGEPAVLQGTKMGHLFLLNRDTGEPLYPVEERPVPQYGVPGEQLSATQPFPTHPKPIHSDDVTGGGLTFIDGYLCKRELAKYRWDGLFTPPTLEGALAYPGTMGGMNFGSVAVDPRRGVMFTTQSHLIWVVQMLERAKADAINPDDYDLLRAFYAMERAPYGALRFPLRSVLGTPCTPTPWGTLTAVDLKSGDVLWQKPLGTTRDLAPFPLWFNSGTPNLGGTLITAGGLVFATGTTDHFVRAYDGDNGELLWEQRTQGTVRSVPATYRMSPQQRQYVVVAVTGRAGRGERSSRLVAYALPDAGGDLEEVSWPFDKAIFVLEPAALASQAALRETVQREIAPRLATDPRVERLVVNLPYDESQTDPVIASAIEVYGAAQALRQLATELDASLGEDMRLEAYLVKERLPRRRVQSWPDGSPSPGVRMVAMLVRAGGTSPEEFDSYWRDRHTSIALAHRVEVLNYSQNTVLENLSNGSDPIDGIVGEQFASPNFTRERMLTQPIQFLRGIRSGRQFIDLGRARSQLMTETVIKSYPTTGD